jgi:anti-sigma B factor antagonist
LTCGPIMLRIKIADKLDVVVVTFNDAKILDDNTIREIGLDFGKLTLEASGDRKLLLNFANVSFMSSSMLGQIVKLSKQAKNDKINLKLCNITPEIMEVFKITKLEKVLDIQKTEAAALEAFGKPRKSWLGG